MKFSILIANYNNGNFFEDCYQSILKQTNPSWECIIVDDASTDNSKEIIQQIIHEDDRFHWYENSSNQGAGFTKRKCVELANGDICGFLDPDDVLEPQAVGLMLEAHAEFPKVSLVHSKWYRLDENLQRIGQYQNGKQVERSKDFLNLKGEISAFSSFKKSFYEQTPGIDPFLQRAVDVDLHLKLYEVGETIFIDEFLYGYRIHSGGISTQQNIKKAEFWRWVVNIKAAERRNINIEDLFVSQFVRRKEWESIQEKYYSLKKFEPLQSLIQKIKKIIS